MNEPSKLGRLIEAPENKDAVHVAIAPVTAGQKLFPGQHIGFLSDGRAGDALGMAHVGVADPFLKLPIAAGERFWMLVYPNTITGLRHDWSHSGFPVPPLDEYDGDTGECSGC